jgi:hypothetical protein
MGGRAGGVSPAGGSAVGDAGASSAFFKMEKKERKKVRRRRNIHTRCLLLFTF